MVEAAATTKGETEVWGLPGMTARTGNGKGNDKSNSKRNGNRRFPSGMTTKKQRQQQPQIPYGNDNKSAKASAEANSFASLRNDKDWVLGCGVGSSGKGNGNLGKVAVLVLRSGMWLLEDAAAAGALGAAVGLEDLFAHAEGLGGDFHQFVVCDELDGLLQREDLEGDEAESVV